MKTQYDFQTAITFLMVGIGLGAALAILMAPRYTSYLPSRQVDGQPSAQRASAGG